MLLRLPSELLDEIIKCLRNQDLKQLACVNSTLKLHVLPVLYRSVTFTIDAHESRDIPPLQSFLQTMIQRPEWCAHVKSLELISHKYPRLEDEWTRLNPLMPRDLDFVAHTLIKANHDPTGELLSELQSGGLRSPAAAIAFLLLLLPSLTTLHLGLDLLVVDDEYSLQFVVGMIKHLVTSRYRRKTRQLPNQLHTLTEIELCSPRGPFYGQTSIEVEDIPWLYYLPNIRSIKICALDNLAELKWPFKPPISETLNTLILQHSTFSPGTLRQFLTASPNLKRFECHNRWDIFNPDYRFLDCAQLRQALETRASSLEHLALSFDFYHVGWDNTRYGKLGSLGDMTAFSALKRLEVPLILLLGWDKAVATDQKLVDHLPLSLLEFDCKNDMWDSLFLPWDEEVMVQQLTSVVMSRKGRLHKLFLTGQQDTKMWSESSVKRVRDACEQAGVNHKLIYAG
ncbi:MAG: hypothetical protein LQ346_002276 [Caloplaca aetnensis]|nr:MAG: hypothetical protein LQ346_002276 [Caloplaca aetnensis]